MNILILLLSLNISFALTEKLIDSGHRLNDDSAWTKFSSSDEVNLNKMFDLLKRSPQGSELFKKAQVKAHRSGKTIMDVVKIGDSSLTDTTLMRKFSPAAPQNVILESQSVVYINRHLSMRDALLDLAHELTHFIYRQTFNPYNEDFNAKDFMAHTIEGQGGEVHAFLKECIVQQELFGKTSSKRSLCDEVSGLSSDQAYKKAVSLFYQIGPYYEKFNQQLQLRQISLDDGKLTRDKINFISSAYGVPYPMAALMEFDIVHKKVCENDRRRFAYMQQKSGRSPASTIDESVSFKKSFEKRCLQKSE